MDWPRLKRLFHLDRFGRSQEASLDEEIRFHLETRIQELTAGGRSPEEARKEALRQFGDPELVAQRCRRIDQAGRRRQLRRELTSDLLQDIRYSLRGLRKAGGFALVAVLSLAVGIGVNSAVFTAIYGVWFSPVPGMTDQDRIVDMVPVVSGSDYWQWAYPDFEGVRDAETPFESLTAWAEGYATVGAQDGGRRALVGYATPGYFHVHGALPVLGRGFLESEEGAPGEHPVLVVSHRFWQEELGGDPEILGRSQLLDGIPHTVIGVAPEGFEGARINMWSLDLWVPLFQHPGAAGDGSIFRDRGEFTVQVMGRLRPGAKTPEARAAVKTVFASLAADYPETNEHRTVKAVSFARFPAQNRDLEAIAVVGICGLFCILLLIICGNLAGMALARAAAREREVGVRLALGSSRVRLVRHLMVEASILTLIGGALGIALATAGMTRVSPMDLNITAPGASFEPSAWTLALSVGISLVAAQAFGLLPALRYSRPELVSTLKDDAGGGGRRVGKLQRLASTFQTGAACLLLLVGALFFRSLTRAEERHIGFRPDGMAVMDFATGGRFLAFLQPSREGYPGPAEGGSVLMDQLLESIGSVPGVASVALSSGFPLDRRRAYLSVYSSDQPAPDSVGVSVEWTRATEGYFATIGSPVLQGRSILRTDDLNSAPVAVVDRSFADRLWPGENPLGRRFSQAGVGDHTPWTVVGVIGHTASSAATENLPQVYFPLRQSRDPVFTILIRSANDPTLLAAPLRAAIREVDTALPAPRLLSAESVVAWATQGQRTGGQVAGGLGLMVLLLAAMGVYGVAALAVTHRTREIGVRIALGAARGKVVMGIFKDALVMTGPGLGVGCLLAVATATALRSTLMGLSPVDPISLLTVGVLLLLVVLAATLAPALRASGIQPMEALRRD